MAASRELQKLNVDLSLRLQLLISRVVENSMTASKLYRLVLFYSRNEASDMVSYRHRIAVIEELEKIIELKGLINTSRQKLIDFYQALEPSSLMRKWLDAELLMLNRRFDSMEPLHSEMSEMNESYVKLMERTVKILKSQEEMQSLVRDCENIMKEMAGADTDEQVMQFFTDRLKLLKAVAKMNPISAGEKLKKFCEEARSRMTLKTEEKPESVLAYKIRNLPVERRALLPMEPDYAALDSTGDINYRGFFWKECAKSLEQAIEAQIIVIRQGREDYSRYTACRKNAVTEQLEAVDGRSTELKKKRKSTRKK